MFFHIYSDVLALFIAIFCLTFSQSFCFRAKSYSYFSTYNNIRLKSYPPVTEAPIKPIAQLDKSGIGIYKILDKDAILHLITDPQTHSTNLRIHQNTTGPVPRSYLPSLMVLQENSTTASVHLYNLLEEGLRWYLDAGGRLSRMEFACPAQQSDVFSKMGFSRSNTLPDDPQRSALRSLYVPADYDILAPSAEQLKRHCEARLSRSEGDASTLHDIIGRIFHDMGDPRSAILPYTKALQANPKSAATFRNLGSAYHSVADNQLAFASYQQAIQLDPQDGLVYLKLAFFYEDFAMKDWPDAETHSKRCYEFYLASVDPEDIAVLTRLGNLLVRQHMAEEAVQVYGRILRLDDRLFSVWFNKAHAQVKLGDLSGAQESLRRTLQIDPTVTAARHMLRALDADEALRAQSAEEDYVRDLFDSYADSYDSHGKKLLYSAPRIIRQELAAIYKSVFADKFDAAAAASGLEQSFPAASEPVGSSCSSYSSFMNNSLDILDIGCGTGQAGAWLKDYAKSLVGVDLSEQMVKAARKKMLYQELHVMSIAQYFSEVAAAAGASFDVVVAADVLAYVGELRPTFQQVSKVLRPSALFVFTVEAAEAPADGSAGFRGFRLLPSGRFGYSKAYVDAVVAESMAEGGCSVLMSRAYSPRLEAGQPIPGYLYIVQKAP